MIEKFTGDNVSVSKPAYRYIGPKLVKVVKSPDRTFIFISNEMTRKCHVNPYRLGLTFDIIIIVIEYLNKYFLFL